MTNFEKIKQMNFDEIAEFIKKLDSRGLCTIIHSYCGGCASHDCEYGLRKWLESEADAEQREEKGDAEIC